LSKVLKAPSIAQERFSLGTSLKELKMREIEERVGQELEKAVKQANAITEKAQLEADKIVGEANKTLQEASLEADKILAQAEADGEIIKNNAYQEGHEKGTTEGFQAGHDEGFQKGLEEGRTQGRAELDKALDELNEFCNNIIKQRQEVIQQLEPDIVQLVFNIAQKVIHDEVSNGEAIRKLIKAILKQASDEDKLLVKVNPDDLEDVKKYTENLTVLNKFSDFRVIEDESIQRGGCIVETSYGYIDAQIDMQMEKIKEVLQTPTLAESQPDTPVYLTEPSTANSQDDK